MPVALTTRVVDGDVEYDAIVLWCVGCEREQAGLQVSGLHMLPVSDTQGKRPVWGWNGQLELVTLEPSILTRSGDSFVCHSFLRDGHWQFLPDSTHSLAGKTVPMVPLPDWVWI